MQCTVSERGHPVHTDVLFFKFTSQVALETQDINTRSTDTQSCVAHLDESGLAGTTITDYAIRDHTYGKSELDEPEARGACHRRVAGDR